MTYDYLKSRDEINLDPAPYETSILADSIASGVRLTTLIVKIPRFELPAFNTHRVMSRNSASSRARPVLDRTLPDGTVKKGTISIVREDPFVPLVFGANKSGMQSTEEVANAEQAETEWRQACRMACVSAEQLAKLGVHKQLANRLLEPFAWQTIIVSSTEWANWDALRVSRHAQGEIALAARNMLSAREASTPVELKPGEWHLPLIFREDTEEDLVSQALMPNGELVDVGGTTEAAQALTLARISAGRCARVSYLTHDGVRDLADDIRLYRQLRERVHMSPLEHPAQVGTSIDAEVTLTAGGWEDRRPIVATRLRDDFPVDDDPMFVGPFIGNFRAPWVQLRKMIPGEDVAPKDGAI